MITAQFFIEENYQFFMEGKTTSTKRPTIQGCCMRKKKNMYICCSLLFVLSFLFFWLGVASNSTVQCPPPPPPPPPCPPPPPPPPLPHHLFPVPWPHTSLIFGLTQYCVFDRQAFCAGCSKTSQINVLLVYPVLCFCKPSVQAAQKSAKSKPTPPSSSSKEASSSKSSKSDPLTTTLPFRRMEVKVGAVGSMPSVLEQVL